MIILDQSHTQIVKVNLENGDKLYVIDGNIYHRNVNIDSSSSASNMLGRYDSLEMAQAVLDDMFNALAVQRRTYIMPEFKNNSDIVTEEVTKTEEVNVEETAPVEDPIDPYEAISVAPKTATVKAPKTTGRKPGRPKGSTKATKTEDKTKRKYTRKA